MADNISVAVPDYADNISVAVPDSGQRQKASISLLIDCQWVPCQ